jgi:ribosome maturation factor RimP
MIRYEKFIGKEVAVGIPHYTQRRPFYFYGILKSADDKNIVIETKKGIHRISLSEIVELNFK